MNATQKPSSTLIYIFLAVLVLSNVITFGVGRYMSSLDSLRSLSIASAKEEMSEDKLISSWIDERTLTFAELGMADHPGMFRYGFFPDTVRGLAKRIELEYGTPSSVVLAQFALESRFGTRDLGANNFFGHTFPVVQQYGTKPHRFTWARTREVLGGRDTIVNVKFAKYRSLEQCFTVHGRLLSTGYASALRFKQDPEQYAREIGRRYATDPRYALKLVTIMQRYSLG